MDLLVSQIKRNTNDDDEDQLNSKNLLVFEDTGTLFAIRTAVRSDGI